jgi:hypothetical protein
MNSNENTDDNIVPEWGVASTRSPNLDPDPVDNSFMDEFDKLDEEALAKEQTTEPAAAEPAAPAANPVEDENFLNDGLNDTTSTTNDTTAAPPEDPTAPGDKTSEPEQPVQNGEEIDPEIANIEQPRNLSEASQNNWKKLRETASRYKKEATEAAQLRQRLTELEQRPAQTPADYEELRKFKQIFDLKNDPEFHSKYEAPIKGAKETIYSILKKNGATDETIASIEKVGGPDKVNESWWKTNVIEKLQLTDAEKLKRSLVDIVDLKERQEKEISDTADRAEQILEDRKLSTQRYFEEEGKAISNHIEELTKDYPWARYQQPKPDASPAELEKIKAHNDKVAGLAQQFQSALYPVDPKVRTEVAAAAVYSHVLAEQVKSEQAAKAQLEARIKALETENNQLKFAGKTPKPSANTTPSKINSNTSDRWKMNASDAIDMGLDEAGA